MDAYKSKTDVDSEVPYFFGSVGNYVWKHSKVLMPLGVLAIPVLAGIVGDMPLNLGDVTLSSTLGAAAGFVLGMCSGLLSMVSDSRKGSANINPLEETISRVITPVLPYINLVSTGKEETLGKIAEHIDSDDASRIVSLADSNYKFIKKQHAKNSSIIPYLAGGMPIESFEEFYKFMSILDEKSNSKREYHV